MEMLVEGRPDMRPDPGFWRGKRVLLTGHTGFKGAWLALWLQRLGARVSAIALPPAGAPNLFHLARVGPGLDSHFCDLRNAPALARRVRAARPELVLHLAAQALVRAGHAAPLQTFATNVMGTVHLLDALRGQADLRVAVVVTTDKVYRHRAWAYPYREDDALGASDPYGASKAAAELATASYRDSFLAAQGVAVATARAGNVIGGGDWAQDRLLPDAMRAWSQGQPLRIRRRQATRPWQHVLEALAAYLRLAQRLWEQPALAGAYNFGPLPQAAVSVGNLIESAAGDGPACAIDYGNEADPGPEVDALALETAHARQALGVSAHWALAEALQRTLHWYRQQQGGADARALCLADIDAWEAGQAAPAGQTPR